MQGKDYSIIKEKLENKYKERGNDLNIAKKKAEAIFNEIFDWNDKKKRKRYVNRINE